MKTLGELDLQGFARRLWERICKDSRDFGRGFTRICEIWERILKDLQGLRDFGRGFARICKTLGEHFGFARLWDLQDFGEDLQTLGEDLQGFVRLWERICKDVRLWRGFGCEDLQDFGRGFARICETLGENLQGFVRLWERIHKYSRDFGRGFHKDL